MSHWDEGLAPLDCHAHVAPDVTEAQVARLGGAQVFGVTRSLAEASAALRIGHRAITWGCGVHPGDAAALAEFEPDRFASLLPRFGLVGEVGLDRRAGKMDRQREVLSAILRLSASQPVIVSIHSAGATSEVLDILEEHPHPGAVLHWFLGDALAIRRARASDLYFSASGAMSDERLGALPRERLLPETDFPSGGKRAGARPGDTGALEVRLAALWGVTPQEVRHQLYRNLREIASRSGSVERFPEALADMLLFA